MKKHRGTMRRWLALTICVAIVLGASASGDAADQPQRVYCVRFSPDGKQILSGGSTRKIQLWDVKTGRELKSFKHPGWLHTVGFSPDGQFALSGTRNRTMRLWDLKTGKMLREFNHRAWVECALFLRDGKRCLSIGGDSVKKGKAAIRVWAPKTGRQVRKFAVPPKKEDVPPKKEDKWGNWISLGSLSKDGTLLATAGRVPLIWDVKTGKVVKKLQEHKEFTWEVALSPDGKTCVSGGADKLIGISRVEDGRRLKTIKQSGAVRAIAISPDGKLFATGGMVYAIPRNVRPRRGKPIRSDFLIRLWNLRTSRQVRQIRAHKFIVESLDFSPNGKMLVSGSFDGTVKLWDAKTGKLIRSFD